MSTAPTLGSHPSDADLTSFVRNETTAEQSESIEKHLRTGCALCLFGMRDKIEAAAPQDESSLTVAALSAEDESARVPSASQLVNRIRKAEQKALMVEVERTVSPSLIAELMLRPPIGRRETVRGSRRYKLLGLSEILREESRVEARRDVARSLELAELAAEVADCLSTAFYGSRIVADARALAWAMVGNGQRVAGEFFAAERAFQIASDLLERGTGNATEIAEVQSLLASLRIDQARFKEAIRLLEDAAASYRRLRLSNLEGRAIFKMGNAAAYSGEPSHALHLFEACLELIDPEESPKMALWAHHNIALALHDSGASHEANEYLRDIGPLYDHFPEDRIIHIQRRWLEGLVLTGMGRADEGIKLLSEIRRLFIEEERAYDTAQVTLDLAGVLLDAGQTDEVKRLVREMYPVFRSQDVHRQAIAALVLFEQAVTTEAATVALARDVGRYLTRARNNPYLRFEPTGSQAD